MVKNYNLMTQDRMKSYSCHKQNTMSFVNKIHKLGIDSLTDEEEVNPYLIPGPKCTSLIFKPSAD